MRAVRQFPASMTSVVDEPLAVRVFVDQYDLE